ncbi:MAG: B12-binding domain-containing radical SAM protein, partial [Bacteroidales bacterium]|nr:B12-binding domain-containing radical SAM protein [Bacteroidales bacterium]
MNILLISPLYPDTYWSFKHALKFISKKASNPPLGLMTVASMLPGDWNKKLVDLNVASLQEANILWADYVFIGAMSIQSASVHQIIKRCKQHNKKIVAGGPLFTGEPESFPDIDHLVLNEAEITLPLFLEDLQKNTPKKIYRTERHADMSLSPIPDYSLIDTSKYAQLGIQYSRGCPYNCEFCQITVLLGHRFRTKSTDQILRELENIYQTGFRGNVFFVDDNFIGNRNKLKNDLLPSMIKWAGERDYPFYYTTEASINLSDDAQLMQQMVTAGFVKVFVGIETPDEASLEECNKKLNKQRDLIKCVNRIQSAGMEVAAGFIVGFDND